MIAGVVFATFEMLAAWAVGDGFWMPLRMIGAILVLGPLLAVRLPAHAESRHRRREPLGV